MIARKAKLLKAEAPDELRPLVYISCRPRDLNEVESVVHRLQRKGIPIAFNRHEIEANESSSEPLLAVREASKIWLVFIGAGGSEGIQTQEYAEAQQRLQSR